MKAFFATLPTFLFLGLCIEVSAQIINVPKRIENKVVNRVNNKIDRGIDKGLDVIEDSLNPNFKKSNTPATQKTDPKKTGATSAAAGSITNENKQTLQSFSNYDFVPGDKVLLYEDFSQDAVGDFPALWTTNKSGEINTLSVTPGN